MRRALFIFAALFTWCGFIHADHRSALVIANHNYAAAELKLEAPDLKAVVARLERHGFLFRDPDEVSLEGIEGEAAEIKPLAAAEDGG